jgi:hypothetical protein
MFTKGQQKAAFGVNGKAQRHNGPKMLGVGDCFTVFLLPANQFYTNKFKFDCSASSR